MWSVLVIAASSLVVTAGCGGEDTAPHTLTVYAGAGLRPAVSELAEEFSRRNDIQVECDYAGSETLLSRIKLARRGDLYSRWPIRREAVEDSAWVAHNRRFRSEIGLASCPASSGLIGRASGIG